MFNRRLVAFLLAIVMVLGLGTMAMAAAPNDKVQVNNMMVDASLVEAKADAQAVEEEAAVPAVQATDTPVFPPIAAIALAAGHLRWTSTPRKMTPQFTTGFTRTAWKFLRKKIHSP